MKVIAITNYKGGVGKTTETATLGAGLAIMGLRVGVVDTDSQGNLGLMFGYAPSSMLHEILVNKTPIQGLPFAIPKDRYTVDDIGGELFIITSDQHTYQIPHDIPDGDVWAFHNAMVKFGEYFNLDVILIDTSPSLSLFDGLILAAADAYIYVTELDAYSLDGVIKAYTSLLEVGREYDTPKHVLGIIPNKTELQTVLHQEHLKQLKEHFKHIVWTEVPRRIVWAEAASVGQSIFRYAPKSSATETAMELSERLYNEVVNVEAR